jgi:hypothetical protein
MELMIIGFIIVWIGLAYLVADFGKNRRIGHSSAFWISVLFSPLLGLLIVLISPEVEGRISQRSNGGNEDRFKVSLDEAKKAAFKGETEKAISLYQDTLYYMSNDYDNLNNKVEQNRQALMNDIRGRIEELKQKL